MSNDAARIVAQWRKQLPKEASRHEVEKVVHAYLGECARAATRGAHFLIVTHKALSQAHRAGHTPHFPGGRLVLSLVHGRRVKGYQILHLLEAIDLVEAYTRESGT